MSALLRIRKAMQTTINHIVLRSREKEIVQSTIERLHWNALPHTAHLDRRSWRLDWSKMIIKCELNCGPQPQACIRDSCRLLINLRKRNNWTVLNCSRAHCSANSTERTSLFCMIYIHLMGFFCSTTWADCVCVCSRVYGLPSLKCCSSLNYVDKSNFFIDFEMSKLFGTERKKEKMVPSLYCRTISPLPIVWVPTTFDRNGQHFLGIDDALERSRSIRA